MENEISKFHVTCLKRNPLPLLFPPSHGLEHGCAHDLAWSRIVPLAREHVMQERNNLCYLSHCVLGSVLQQLTLYPNTGFFLYGSVLNCAMSYKYLYKCLISTRKPSPNWSLCFLSCCLRSIPFKRAVRSCHSLVNTLTQ